MLVGECVGKSDSPNRKIWITLPRSHETTTHTCIHKPNKKTCWPATLVDQQVTRLNRMSFPFRCQEDSYLTYRLRRSSFGKMPLFNVLEIISLQFNKIKSSFQNLCNKQKTHFGSNQEFYWRKQECFNSAWASSTGANATCLSARSSGEDLSRRFQLP